MTAISSEIRIAVIGLGYVGLHLAVLFDTRAVHDRSVVDCRL